MLGPAMLYRACYSRTTLEMCLGYSLRPVAVLRLSSAAGLHSAEDAGLLMMAILRLSRAANLHSAEDAGLLMAAIMTPSKAASLHSAEVAGLLMVAIMGGEPRQAAHKAALCKAFHDQSLMGWSQTLGRMTGPALLTSRL